MRLELFWNRQDALKYCNAHKASVIEDIINDLEKDEIFVYAMANGDAYDKAMRDVIDFFEQKNRDLLADKRVSPDVDPDTYEIMENYYHFDRVVRDFKDFVEQRADLALARI